MNNEIFEYLERKVYSGKWLSDNHNNYDFLEFWDKFCKESNFDKAKNKFHYHMKKLVNAGMCKKSFTYLSQFDFHNFGRKTIIIYEPLITSKKLKP